MNNFFDYKLKSPFDEVILNSEFPHLKVFAPSREAADTALADSLSFAEQSRRWKLLRPENSEAVLQERKLKMDKAKTDYWRDAGLRPEIWVVDIENIKREFRCFARIGVHLIIIVIDSQTEEVRYEQTRD